MNTHQRLITVFILLMLIPALLGINEFAQSLPAMTRFFHSSMSSMQFTISLFLFGMAIGQWICRLLSNRLSKKPILLSGALLYLITSLLCLFSTHQAELLVSRFFQGIGAGAFAMISPALLREAIDKDNVGKASSYYSMSYALIPLFAPVIGGYIQGLVGWSDNFTFLFLVALLFALIGGTKLPENKSAEKPSLHFRQLLQTSRTLWIHFPYMRSVLCMIFSWSTIIAFSMFAPFLLQSTLGASPVDCGNYSFLACLGFLLGYYCNVQLRKKGDAETVIKVGLFLAIFICTIQVFLVALGYFNLGIVMIPTVILMGAIGLIFPGLYSQATAAFTENTGLASSLIGCFVLLGSAVLTGLMTLFEPDAAISLPVINLLLVLLCFILFFLRDVSLSNS
jgi:MFS family permease